MRAFHLLAKFAACAALTAILLSPWTLGAAPTDEQRSEVRDLKVEIRKASNFLKQGRVAESTQTVKLIIERLQRLEGVDPELQEGVDQLFESLAPAHALLELEGVTLPRMRNAAVAQPTEMMAPAVPGTPTPPASTLPTMFPATNLSFTKHIAPVIVARCGNCHVSGARGGFSSSSYEVLMKGPAEGVVIFPGQDGSRFVEVIETGDMPRGGQKVSPAELTALKTWIKEGAKFDGADPKANLASLAPGAAPMPMPRLEVASASGNEKVSFGRDIAPVLVARCVSCHDQRNPPGGFSLASFQTMLRGGDSGAPLTPGKPNESLLIQLFKAPAPDRMPRNGPPLTDDQIRKFETWITEGAKFDGDSPTSSMPRVAAYAFAKNATHDELAKARVETSKSKIQLGLPGVAMSTSDRKDVFVMGALGQEANDEFADQAEKAADDVRRILKAPAGQPLVKGRVSLFLVKAKYDYNEFSKMVERRDVPPQWQGHYWYDVTDAYGMVQLPVGDAYDLDAMFAQVIASNYVASLDAPDWFADGVGRVVASRVSGKDPRVVEWGNQLQSAVGAMKKPDDFVQNKLAPDQNGAVSFAFMKTLMGRGQQFDALMQALRKGMPFDQAFAGVYGKPPSDVAKAWIASGGR
ncbi:c-type cytochrome domain-containing protein [Blastopirellula retiformator]|uniref:Planctomycete cytochrome C n=1 Tax=Blastopirellula retiformator TaxID=2527970 RepID=A0A5C5UZ97_9BACT|nr:c-type cytochrome domain-containing protein [Blastopirellula retiformator]TWT31686.1 Planctomycete cytochrome C [Blastopirellula retiformator]